ncbi:MAG: gamma-glutamyltransferase, partial [Acidimicrobiia bacterium]
DALIAATLTAMCSEPGVCAPGGGGFITLWPAGQDPVNIDGYMTMPGLDGPPNPSPVTRTVEMEYGGGVSTGVGPGSIAVPGAFAAFDVAHQRWGGMPWSRVLGGVADALADGFPLPQASRYYLGFSGEPIFGFDPASRQALFDGDRLRDVDEMVKVPGLCDTLRHIGDGGAETFYRGDLAAQMVSDLTDRGGLITRRDLTDYRALIRPALLSRLRDWTIATVPPPAVGGVTLSAILRLVQRSSDPLDPGQWAGAQEEVFRARLERLEQTTDRAATGWTFLATIPDDATESGSTVSIAVADGQGTVAAATMSGGYGSGVIPTGTGLWMNNSLGEIELNPGHHSVPPGERLMSNMAPTVAAGPGRRLAVGSPGADRITSALAITLTLALSGQRLEEAVEHPRLHVEMKRGTVAVEPGLVLDQSPLTPRHFPSPDMYFGGVTAAEVGAGRLSGYADTRRTGGVAFVRSRPRTP